VAAEALFTNPECGENCPKDSAHSAVREGVVVCVVGTMCSGCLSIHKLNHLNLMKKHLISHSGGEFALASMAGVLNGLSAGPDFAYMGLNRGLIA
jgi:hypothetical protein